MQDPREVTHGLREIAALLKFAGEPKFKIKAYEHAAEVVKTVGSELGTLVEQGRLRELEGIGRSLSRQIQELWNSGSSEYLRRLQSTHPEGAAELIAVQGLTPRRIRALHAALGIRSLAELRAACSAGSVRQVPGFGSKTEQKLLAACERGLAPDQDEQEPLLLARALELAAEVERELRKIAPQVQLAGALRRGEELVHELEFVVSGDVERALEQLSHLRAVLRIDRAASVAYLAHGLRIVLHAAADDFGGVLARATGNREHVAALCDRAAARGFCLASAGCGASRTSPRSFASERELYAALDLACIPPELRQGRGELSEAQTDDFTDLVELADIQGMVHCHTTYSDGRNSIAEMAEAAHALGMKYITITDHSPSAHYASGVTLDRLQQQWDEIAAVQERVPIRILRGTESDILSDGSLDFPDAVLERFDVVIASIHARHRLDERAMTERLTRALSLPVFKIWGHALGRILQRREPIACDVPAVLDVLARSRGAIEINADPHRLDLPAHWLPAARARRIPFVISVDAHSVAGLRALRYGVLQARRGGVRKGEVLNTASADAFADRVKPA